MFSRIVLCAFPHRLTAGVWQLERLVSAQSFDNDETGLNAFRAFMHQYRRVPVSLLVDAVEEDYRFETLPHTTGAARHTLLERKLNQLYRGSRFRAAQFMGRASTQRRDDQFLCIALSRADIIQPWLIAMDEQQTPLGGVYLLPTISQRLIDKLKLDAPHLLLLNDLPSGLRQSYFDQGKLRLSRLAPYTEGAERQTLAHYLSETERTRLYLQSQRLIAPNARLSVLVLGNAATSEPICNQMRQELNLEAIALDADKMAVSMGLPTAALDRFPELLFMHALVKGPRPVDLAPLELSRRYRVLRSGSLLHLMSAAVATIGIVWTLSNLLDARTLNDAQEQARWQTAEFERRYSDVARNFPQTPLPGQALKTALDLAEAIHQSRRTPQRLMQVVAAALETHPEIQLNRLRWMQTNNPNQTDDDSKPGAGSTQAPGAAHWREVGFVDGELYRFNGDYRAALENVNRYTEALRTSKDIEKVEIVQQPVNVNSHANLQGSTLDEAAQQLPAAQFKLKILLKEAQP